MRRMTITPEIEALAEEYKERLLYKTPKNSVVSRACSNLKFLRDKINEGGIEPLQDIAYVDYIERIENRYEILLTMHPKDFCDEFDAFNEIVGGTHLSDNLLVKVNRKGESIQPRNVKFYELLVWALRYENVQGSIFPDYIRKLGIRTCVYCNAQYAIATRQNKAFYQLDHCFPKSRYPFLATSFFNLQPSCGSCNQRKSGIDLVKGNYNLSIWKEQNDVHDSYFDFHIEDGSLAQYMTSQEKKDLEIELVNTVKGIDDLDELLTLYMERFQTKEVYLEHREEAEEVIWKKYVYTTSYVESLQNAFNETFFNKTGELKRMLLGTYTKKEDVYKRPLTKMMQDIAKQLKIETLVG